MKNFEDRFKRIFKLLVDQDYESALTLICPLIDRAGKELYGSKKISYRFKKVISDNYEFVFWVMSGGQFVLTNDLRMNFPLNNSEHFNIEDAIYKLVRNNLIHEAELSSKINFADDFTMGPNGDELTLPKNLMWGLAFMLTYLECYKNSCPNNLTLSLRGINSFSLNEIWGNKQELAKKLTPGNNETPNFSTI